MPAGAITIAAAAALQELGSSSTIACTPSLNAAAVAYGSAGFRQLPETRDRYRDAQALVDACGEVTVHVLVEPPLVLGHECVARVADAGVAASGAVPSDLVAVPWAINCRTREACCTGLTAHCSSVVLCTRTLFAVHDHVRAPVGGD
ncbi:alcohol dehydrogenase catalytic domain-containing protein [Streptomyces sp. NPDC056637]|uniref:alcohol dehydrogenase catalytic domain-containing protein n=1 Tax=unclassified Streptomyces TaxID=2593676 RepID=UPI00363A173A